MMSESKILATKVARLGVLVLALLAALVAVQAFGAKPAQASIGPGALFHVLEELDGVVRGADDLAEPVPLKPDPAALTNDKTIRDARKRAPWADGDGGKGAGEGPRLTDTEVAERKEALKSELEDTIEYVHDGGCLIAKVAADSAGGSPTDHKVRHMVKTDFPKKSYRGSSGSEVVKRKKVKSDLVEINHLVRGDMRASYSNAEPDDGSDVAATILSGAVDAGCGIKDAIKSM